MTQAQLALYITPFCGFCRYVISAIQELGLEVEIRDIASDREHLEDLYRARQRLTVPVLRITTEESDQWMPESRDIVEYLRKLQEGMDLAVDD